MQCLSGEGSPPDVEEAFEYLLGGVGILEEILLDGIVRSAIDDFGKVVVHQLSDWYLDGVTELVGLVYQPMLSHLPCKDILCICISPSLDLLVNVILLMCGRGQVEKPRHDVQPAQVHVAPELD